MPVNTEDPLHLLNFAQSRGFRPIREDETLAQYRIAFANSRDGSVDQGKDPIEAAEIRYGKGWNQWSDEQFMEVIMNNVDYVPRNPLLLKKAVQLGLLG